jgi:hypothetical protein
MHRRAPLTLETGEQSLCRCRESPAGQPTGCFSTGLARADGVSLEGPESRELAWMRERVLQIRLARLSDGPRLVPASEYLELCRTVDWHGH